MFTSVAEVGNASRTKSPRHLCYLTQEGGLSSDDGVCRPFDAKASGTVFGHGAGVVALRRLKNAIADGDHIHAVIRGVGINNDGADKISYTAPTLGGQADAIRRAHKDAGIAPDTVSYIECHGTATPLGDPIEIKGLRQAFGDVHTDGGFALGSVKGNIGHLDAAAGVDGVIKTALMLTTEQSHQWQISALRIHGSNWMDRGSASEWPLNGPLHAGVSSFGIGGTNVHLVMEEAPDLPRDAPACSVQAIVLSGQTSDALAGDFDAIAAVQARLKAADIPCSRLHTSHAFRSHMMDPVCEALEGANAETTLRPTQIPYVSCVTGDWVIDGESTDPAYWANQARAAVNFGGAAECPLTGASLANAARDECRCRPIRFSTNCLGWMHLPL